MSVYLNKTRKVWVYDFQINNNRYAGDCIDRDGKPVKNKTQARAAEEIIKVRVREGAKKRAPSHPGTFTFAEICAHYLEELQNKADLKNIETYITELLDYFGAAADLRDIDELTIENYRLFAMAQRKKIYIGKKDGSRQYKNGNALRAPKTVNAYLQTIDRAWNAFRRAPKNKPVRHQIPEPPEIRYCDVPRRTPTPVPHADSLQLLSAAAAPEHNHVRLAYIICVQTGMREGECVSTRCAQYLAQEKIITLTAEQTKSKAGRFVPVNGIAAAAIDECMKTGDLLWDRLQADPDLAEQYEARYGIRRRADIPLILYRHKGTGLPRPVKHIASSAWKTIRAETGISCRWHDTRAAFCTNALRSADIETVRKLAGHQNITTTQYYLEASSPQKHDAVARLAENYVLPVTASTAAPLKQKKSQTKVPNTGPIEKAKTG